MKKSIILVYAITLIATDVHYQTAELKLSVRLGIVNINTLTRFNLKNSTVLMQGIILNFLKNLFLLTVFIDFKFCTFFRIKLTIRLFQ